MCLKRTLLSLVIPDSKKRIGKHAHDPWFIIGMNNCLIVTHTCGQYRQCVHHNTIGSACCLVHVHVD